MQEFIKRPEMDSAPPPPIPGESDYAGERDYSDQTTVVVSNVVLSDVYRITLQSFPVRNTAVQQTEEKFLRLVNQWRRETRHVSSIYEKSMNMAYQKIIGMGHEALPYILRDFEQTHDDWLWALQAITDAAPDPMPEQYEDFGEVVEAWLNWARDNRHL